MPAYYLIAVSTKANLESCMLYGMAGLTSSINGVWAFVDINEGDFVSFLYGARVYNLYRVKGRRAFQDAEDLPPWPPLYFKASKKTYAFPFRLDLEPVRLLNESLVRTDFSYIAQNLMLRGGYAKSHFQADQTTLQTVSQLGTPYKGTLQVLPLDSLTFTPQFALGRVPSSPPIVFRFKENILHAAIKRHLRNPGNLDRFLSGVVTDTAPTIPFEILGERALPEGLVDILIKVAAPAGGAGQVLVEVKTGAATLEDVH